MKALAEYRQQYGSLPGLDEKLEKGLEYILRHNCYKRLSDGTPIDPAMTKNFYPWPYKTNILEVLLLMKRNSRLSDPRCAEALSLLKGTCGAGGSWKQGASFMKKGWVDFDPLNKPGEWISYMAGSLF